ncbi:hypothetical protein GCM10010211_75930 [Streptomyces albospinus]|uniref:Cholesterol esterase n=1 Tax=Streptomyces albospinus TaxID=285515 RepID=A0ABQ2VNK8_9ACTN|nr:DUF6230 family protein [Streptomyces albospinus]GGU97446.1 hypothetical protein GCM10010211_75930 [Streptomyces albospinus]
MARHRTAGRGPGRHSSSAAPAAGTNWQRAAVAAVLALAASAMTVWSTTAAGVPVNFAISGSTFQVTADQLKGRDAVQYASFHKDARGRNRPVAVAGIGHATLTNVCQSSVARTPFGPVTLTIRGGRGALVTAEDMVIDLKQVRGDLHFGDVQMGRDASTLDAGAPTGAALGAYGQQAKTLDITDMRLSAWSLAAGSFSLRDATMAIRLGNRPCT